MKYKEGDRVRIKSIDWYNENKDNYGSIYAGNGFCFWKSMARLCGEIMKITSVKVDPEDSNKGYYFMENSEEKWTNEMIEGLVEEETQSKEMLKENAKHYWKLINGDSKSKFKVGDKVTLDLYPCVVTAVEWKGDSEYVGYVYTVRGTDFGKKVKEADLVFRDVEEETKPKYEDEVTGEYYSTPKYLVRPNGYQFVDENGNVINAQKIVLEKKRKEYPKTYVECCELLSLGEDGRLYTKGYKASLIQDFHKLLICRDAYWKIAGEKMGLGKPWEPIDNSEVCYGIFTWAGEIQHDTTAKWCILTFPTEEMRDAFYEHFKDEIEICKELL